MLPPCGRTIEGISEALAHMERVKPPELRLDVRLSYASNISFAEQVRRRGRAGQGGCKDAVRARGVACRDITSVSWSSRSG